DELADQPAIGARPAGDRHDPLQATGALRLDLQVRQHDAPVLEVDPPAERVGQRAGLLVNFLLHKVLVFAPRRADWVPGDHVDLRIDRHPVERLHVIGVARDGRYLAALKEDHPARVLEDGRDVGRDEHLAVAQAERHTARVADPHRNQTIRLVSGEDDDRVRAAQPQNGAADRFDQRKTGVSLALDQMHDHLGCGFRGELDPLCFQLGAQLAEVLDNAVMYDDGAPVLADMRVRVARAGDAMRRPAGVADANMAVERRVVHALHEVGQLADVAPDRDRVALQHGNPRRVVAAIFKTLQAGQNDRGRVTRTDVSHDSTHSGFLPGAGMCVQAERRLPGCIVMTGYDAMTLHSGNTTAARFWATATPRPTRTCAVG